MTEPHDKTKRFIQSRCSMLTLEGNRFLKEYERRGKAVLHGEATDLEMMANQAWFADQFRLLPPYDREIILNVIQFQFSDASSVEETIEEMIEDAHENLDRGGDLVAYAQQLQAYAGEPLRQDLDLREAGEVLKRLLF